MYNVENSTSAKSIDPLKILRMDYGSFFLQGTEYSDKMCLNQNRNDRTDASGRLCVRSQPFISINKISGSFSANSIVGLAPNFKSKSYVENLFSQGQISDKIVGLNYEDPNDQNSVSTVSFGYYDFNQIMYGEQGLSYFDNIGLNVWALILKDMKFKSQSLQTGNQGERMAVIDSANTTIQIPTSQFQKFKEILLSQDPTVTEADMDGETVLTSRKSCSYLQNIYGDLTFNLSSSLITIKPKGYLFNLPN
jgi:hypothetical protein